ncbi:MAG TPA: tail fiber domain-containing protein [Ferruginibacter sp.]|nr:tail fiber domain-containing protein [Ferruginibacter sp.]
MKNFKLLIMLPALFFTTSIKAQLSWLTSGNTLTATGIFGGNTGSNYDILFKRNGIPAGLLNVSVGTTSWGVGALQGSTGANNTAMGYYALSANTTGTNNVADGNQALNRNTSGTDNIASGYQALLFSQTGLYNIATGSQALMNNSGNGNVAYGFHSLYTNTTGSYNTAVGDSTDVSTAGLTNATAIGAYAIVGQSNSIVLGGTGTHAVNVGIGITSPNSNALLDLSSTTQGLLPPRIALTNTGSPTLGNVTGMILYNTATSGSGGTAVTPGYYYNNGTNWVRLIDAISTGWNLTGNPSTTPGTDFMGTTDNNDVMFKRNNILAGLLNDNLGNTTWGVGAFNLTASGFAGGSNTAIGYEVLDHTNGSGPGSGSLNTGTGYQSLFENIGGDDNSAYGANSLFDNTSGRYNTAVGFLSLVDNTTGVGNSSLGWSSLISNKSGTYNTALGYDADLADTALTNSTALGNGAIASTSNTIQLGNSSIVTIEGQVAYTHPSDARFKNNIKPSTLGLDFIKQLKPITYKFDTKKFDLYLMQGIPDSVKARRMKDRDYTTSSNITHAGFVAQDVEAICKKNGYYFDGLHVPDAKNKTDHYSLAYSQFVVPLVNAVQELSAQNDSLKNTVQQQEEQLNDLKAIVSQMQSSIKLLQKN